MAGRMTPGGSRHKRPAPGQTRPVRNPILSRGKSANPAPDTAAHMEHRASSEPGKAPQGVLRDVLECGVHTAYTVIDDYMRRGYEAARLKQDGANGRGKMNENKPNYGSS